ncbi:hypothetical protein KXR53_04985 [Inquilinus limosus]|uniref:hypothetical protein n=1 Tax=Inquilinus limosus TaxID=171674 RepID=UPI003F14D917
MIGFGRSRYSLVLASIPILLYGCVSLVSPYDASFDQGLNKLSEDTARFTAAAEAGGSERLAASKEAVAYYAVAYNTLDRLSQRAMLTRGSVPCPNNSVLKTFSEQPTSSSELPDDYLEFDCREYQLYSVRFFVDQLKHAQAQGGTLNAGEAKALGGQLQISILGAIQTFIVNKPEDGE